uniref:Uncharacterized protein n=1 Tax=Oryza nivara TaxID=4536 RepID=A0A0E0FL91_ORYNI
MSLAPRGVVICRDDLATYRQHVNIISSPHVTGKNCQKMAKLYESLTKRAPQEMQILNSFSTRSSTNAITIATLCLCTVIHQLQLLLSLELH